MIDRRGLIGLVGGAVVAGCTSRGGGTATDSPTPDDSDSDMVANRDDDYPNDDIRAIQVAHYEERFTLKPTEYEVFDLNTEDGTFVLSYDVVVKGDSGVDIIVMTEGDYVKYMNDEDPEYLTEASGTNVGSADVESYIIDKRTVMVFDYTAEWESLPGEKPVDVTATIDVAEAPFSQADVSDDGPPTYNN